MFVVILINYTACIHIWVVTILVVTYNKKIKVIYIIKFNIILIYYSFIIILYLDSHTKISALVNINLFYY